MKIYYSNIASIKNEKETFPNVGVLISYYGLKELNRPIFCNSLFLDSGAFSAWSQNVEINIDEYIHFVKKNKRNIDIIASLDNIKSYEKSLNNYFIMKDNDLKILPTYHYGEPFWVIEEYIKYTNYIALGGIAKIHKQERIKWLNNVFSKFWNTEIKFHGFGIQDRKILLKYPWHSVDSSSAHVMARFGGICTPWGDFKINPEVNYKDLKWISPLSEARIKEWVENQMGVDYESAKRGTVEGTNQRIKINVKYYEQLSKKNSKEIFNIKGQRGLFL